MKTMIKTLKRIFKKRREIILAGEYKTEQQTELAA